MPLPSIRIVVPSAMLFLALITCGCGSSEPETYPVTGIVRFPDGTPVTSGTVEFELVDGKSMTATGILDSEGRFTLGMFEPGGGTLAGEYRIAVFSNFVIGDSWERPDRVREVKLASEFQDFQTTPLRRTVEPTNNEFTIEVEYAPVDEDDIDAT